MKIVVQRVSEASVTIDGNLNGEIETGYVVLLGIENADTQNDVEWLCQKLLNLRIFGDEDGKMNLSLLDISGEILLISQFTLHASTKKGNRPSFVKAARPEHAIPLYELFRDQLEAMIPGKVKCGIFGADMKVALVNDGPVTIIIDSQNKE